MEWRASYEVSFKMIETAIFLIDQFTAKQTVSFEILYLVAAICFAVAGKVAIFID